MGVARINGLSVYYDVQGKGDPLLFIHGLGSSSQDWELQTQHFAKTHRVIAYDVRGHGRTGKPAGLYTMEQFADDAAALLDHLHIESVPIVGISMGGMIAQELALRHPQLVQRLILVNTVPKVPDNPFKLLQRWLVLNLFGLKGMGRFFGKQLFPDPAHEELRNRLATRWARNEMPAYKAATNAILKWSALDRMGQLTVPVFVLSAEHDYWPTDLKRKLFRDVRDLTVVVQEGVRHMAPLESPEAFNQLLAECLAG